MGRGYTLCWQCRQNGNSTTQCSLQSWLINKCSQHQKILRWMQLRPVSRFSHCTIRCVRCISGLTLWFEISAGRLIFRKHPLGQVCLLISVTIAVIIGKQALAPIIYSSMLLLPRTLIVNPKLRKARKQILQVCTFLVVSRYDDVLCSCK